MCKACFYRHLLKSSRRCGPSRTSDQAGDRCWYWIYRVKWVSEWILLRAAEETSLNPVLVRVGQVCGGLDGSWNTNEWFPSIVQSTAKLRCFPDDNRVCHYDPRLHDPTHNSTEHNNNNSFGPCTSSFLAFAGYCCLD
ncbi:hypothetical protein AcW1_008396 [Taiwanofungus camphoratus]|nr:hypothetical protein AcV5_008688 [Antrodia cinnamomea]KAI0951328.1 hypothetical protein AcW1_008396 [Antrodia cinnamomea]KAI0956234.1 hypothetical protein AcV7_006684 [Antrodia cinnamomea]